MPSQLQAPLAVMAGHGERHCAGAARRAVRSAPRKLVAGLRLTRADSLSVVLRIRVSMVDGLGPSVALALRACCACPNSLPANLSVPGHHVQP